MKNHGKNQDGSPGNPLLLNTPKVQPWILRLALVAGATLWLAIVGSTWADAAQSGAGVSNGDDDYSFNWLDPEKKIYVLQNRRYHKADHALVSVMAGPGLSNPYRTTYSLDVRGAYYFSEALGFETFYSITSNTSNNTSKALTQAATNTLAVVREIHSGYGGLLHWSPWYAKINVFNKILYFDWYFTGGAGTLQTAVQTSSGGSSPVFVDQSLFSLFAGTGHQYHISQDWTVRLDLTGAFYSAPVFGTTGDTAWYSNYNFEIGVGYRL